jgi:hypothetical protein
VGYSLPVLHPVLPVGFKIKNLFAKIRQKQNRRKLPRGGLCLYVYKPFHNLAMAITIDFFKALCRVMK